MTLATRVAAAALTLAALCAPTLASADAELRSDGARVFERSHLRTVELEPLAAAVTDSHVFATRTPLGSTTESTQLFYEFDLPREATITDLAVTLGRATHRATALDARASIRMVPDASGGEADLALLRQIESEDRERARYQLVIFPLDGGGATVEINWALPAILDATRVSVELPGRGTAGNLSASHIVVKPRGDGPISRLESLALDGVPISAGVSVAHPSGGTSLAARAVFTGRGAPVLRYHSTSLGGDLSALTVSAIVPLAISSGERFARLVILIDVSRSMGKQGVAAAGLLAESIVKSMPRSAMLEVVLFDRTARGVFGKLSAIDASTSAAVVSALQLAPLSNGSDLGVALSRASSLLSKSPVRASTGVRTDAVIVISDGVTPLALTGDALRSAAGDFLADRATFFAVELGVSSHPLSRRPGGALRELVATSGGRAWAIWAHRAEREAAAIADRLEPAPHLTALSVTAGGARIERLDLPAHLSPGSGFVATTLWRGDAPAALTVRARRGGKPFSATLRRARSRRSSEAARALKELTPELIDIVGSDGRELARAGLTIGLVSDRFSFVIPDPSSRFAKDRLAFARRWGSALYRRAPTRFEVGSESYYKSLVPASPIANAPAAIGTLDRDTVSRTVRDQLFRPLRHCYERALRNSKKLAGLVTVRFEVARSEVMAAAIDSAPGIPRSLQSCIVDVAYQLETPPVFGDSNTTYVIRYPFRLKRSERGAAVERGQNGAMTTPIDAGDPLDGLE